MSFYQSGFYQPGFYQAGFYQPSDSGGVLPPLVGPFYSDRIVKIVDCSQNQAFGCGNSCLTINDGTQTPTMREAVTIGNSEIFWVTWLEKISQGFSISSSSWVVPDGLTVTHVATNEDVTDDESREHPESNGARILFENSLTEGTYTVTNTAVLTGPNNITQSISRSFNVQIRTVV